MVSVLHLSPIHGEFRVYVTIQSLSQHNTRALGFQLQVFHPGPQAAPIQNSKWALEEIGMEYKNDSMGPGAEHLQGSLGCRFNYHLIHQMAQGPWAIFSLQ